MVCDAILYQLLKKNGMKKIQICKWNIGNFVFVRKLGQDWPGFEIFGYSKNHTCDSLTSNFNALDTCYHKRKCTPKNKNSSTRLMSSNGKTKINGFHWKKKENYLDVQPNCIFI